MIQQITIVFLLLVQSLFSFGHSSAISKDLVALGTYYRNFHFSNDPPQQVTSQLDKIQDPKLNYCKKFIIELVKTNNNILSDDYLKRPDSATLQYLFIIRSINWNLHESEAMDNELLVDSLLQNPTSLYELVACYYNMIFVSVSNKRKPFHMNLVNFTPDEYGLDETEKGIFFLTSVNLCGTMIWGYMNVVDPPNYKVALQYIRQFPMFNYQPYYQYQQLNFPDFLLTLDKRNPKGSFKKFYINNYLDLLLNHVRCLSQNSKNQDKKNKVMMESIMRNSNYYQYSEHPEIFENIFKRIDR